MNANEDSEQTFSRSIRSVLDDLADGESTPESPAFREALTAIEFLLSGSLADVYPFWKHESLDGLFVAESHKVGPGAIELLGVCVLTSDQTAAPFNLRIKLSPSADKIEWMECKVGKRGTDRGQMELTPWPRWRNKPSGVIGRSKDDIDWVYQITFGANRP